MSKSISIFTFIKGLYNSIIVQIPASISKGCEVQEKRQQEVNQQEQGCVEFLMAWSRLGSRGQGAGSFRGFICHFHLRKSVAGFAVDWLASCLLYRGHADFTLSKIRSSCRWSVSLVRKEKKNHAKSFRRY